MSALFPNNELMQEIFTDTYGIVPVLAGVYGLTVAHKWGGFTSVMGKAVKFFSLGLLAQGFGQATYSVYYLVLGIEVPYPSIGDLGYFGSIPLYILGIYFLGKAAGMRISTKSLGPLVVSVLIPLLMLALSYVLFLSTYEVDPAAPLVTFLDFGYPLGQALYISLAIMAYFLSRPVLGGVMKPRIIFVLLALVVQYLADFTFLYQVINDSWVAGGINDFMYLLAYAGMFYALVSLEDVYFGLKTKFGGA